MTRLLSSSNANKNANSRYISRSVNTVPNPGKLAMNLKPHENSSNESTRYPTMNNPITVVSSRDCSRSDLIFRHVCSKWMRNRRISGAGTPVGWLRAVITGCMLFAGFTSCNHGRQTPGKLPDAKKRSEISGIIVTFVHRPRLCCPLQLPSCLPVFLILHSTLCIFMTQSSHGHMDIRCLCEIFSKIYFDGKSVLNCLSTKHLQCQTPPET